MAIRSVSTRRVTSDSALSGDATVIYSGATNTYTLGGVAASSINVGTGTSGPIISNVQYLYANNTVISGDVAVSTLGGNILINGSNFVANSAIYVNNALVSNTVVSSTQIIAVCPANTGNVTLMIFNNATNAGGIGPNVRYDVVPVWNTSAVSVNNGLSVSEIGRAHV